MWDAKNDKFPRKIIGNLLKIQFVIQLYLIFSKFYLCLIDNYVFMIRHDSHNCLSSSTLSLKCHENN